MVYLVMHLVVYDVAQLPVRPVLFIQIKPGEEDDPFPGPSTRQEADQQMRQCYKPEGLLHECPIPRLYGVSFVGTDMRVYCDDKASKTVTPSVVEVDSNFILPNDYLEDQWSVDIMSAQGFSTDICFHQGRKRQTWCTLPRRCWRSNNIFHDCSIPRLELYDLRVPGTCHGSSRRSANRLTGSGRLFGLVLGLTAFNSNSMDFLHYGCTLQTGANMNAASRFSHDRSFSSCQCGLETRVQVVGLCENVPCPQINVLVACRSRAGCTHLEYMSFSTDVSWPSRLLT
ncbi:hypothetical protein C8F01DRAFT_265070, partial [Mycena amicta]